MLDNRGDFCIVACRAGIPTSKKIIKYIGDKCSQEKARLEEKEKKVPRLRPEERRALEFARDTAEFGIDNICTDTRNFRDGEIFVGLKGNVRGKDVYLVQNTLDPSHPERTSSNIMELFITADAVIRSGAANINAIIPYFSYCKQERRRGREAISAALIVRLLETAGINSYIVTIDLHSAAMKGFSNPKHVIIENLYASSVLINYFQEKMGPDDVYAAPDTNAAKMVQHYSKVTGREMVIGYKVRSINQAHKVDEHKLLGEVKGKNLVIIDDQIATAGTMGKLAKLAKDKGALSVRGGVTHGPLFEDAEEDLQKLYSEKILDEIVTTDTLMLSDKFQKRNPFIKVLPVTEFLGQAMYELHVGGSIKKLYNPLLRKELFGLEETVKP